MKTESLCPDSPGITKTDPTQPVLLKKLNEVETKISSTCALSKAKRKYIQTS